MTRRAHLPVYEAALDKTVHFEKLVSGFSCHHHFTLGTELPEGSHAVLQQVLRANNAATCEQRVAERLELQASLTSARA